MEVVLPSFSDGLHMPLPTLGSQASETEPPSSTAGHHIVREVLESTARDATCPLFKAGLPRTGQALRSQAKKTVLPLGHSCPPKVLPFPEKPGCRSCALTAIAGLF